MIESLTFTVSFGNSAGASSSNVGEGKLCFNSNPSSLVTDSMIVVARRVSRVVDAVDAILGKGVQ